MLSRSGLRLGVALPQGFEDGAIDMPLIARYVRRAEEMGFDDVWTIEQIAGHFPILEPVALLSYLAAITSRIRLGTAVLVTNLRNPVQLAKALSTLDHMSSGRLTVGIGLGATTRLYPAFGMPEERRVARFIEGVKLLKALWTEPSVSIDGDFWKPAGLTMEPKPLQKPHPPLWFGAHSEAAMQRAARFGDGWMGAGSTFKDEFFLEIARMRQILAQRGRDESTFPLSKRIYIAVDEDEARARRQVEAWLGDFYGRPEATPENWAVFGSAAHCVDTLSRMREAGLTHLMLHTAPTDSDQLETLAAKVAPQL